MNDIESLTQESLRLLRYPTQKELADDWDAYLKPVASSTLPYLYDIVRLKLGDVQVVDGDIAHGARKYYGILRSKLTRPTFLELIWNYWHEEGMLVQTLNVISWRVPEPARPRRTTRSRCWSRPAAPAEQPPLGMRRGRGEPAHGRRRASEYHHEYGLPLPAGPSRPSWSRLRPRFLESFHTILHLCTIYYKEVDDPTVVADAFPSSTLSATSTWTSRKGRTTSTATCRGPPAGVPDAAVDRRRPEMREFLRRPMMAPTPRRGWTGSTP